MFLFVINICDIFVWNYIVFKCDNKSVVLKLGNSLYYEHNPEQPDQNQLRKFISQMNRNGNWIRDLLIQRRPQCKNIGPLKLFICIYPFVIDTTFNVDSNARCLINEDID